MSLSKLAQHQTPDLPQLCLLAVISQMTLVDRISALQVCPQWHHRVKETNQATVKSLAIVVSSEPLTVIEGFLNKKFFFFHNHTIAGLVTSPPSGLLPPLFPVHRFTAWSCLQFADEKNQLNSATIHQIMTTFPRLAELTFIEKNKKSFNHLLEMLHAERPWRCQLTKLKVISNIDQRLDSNDVSMLGALFASINGLPALQYLTLRNVPLHTYPLPILAQLKEINIEGNTLLSWGLSTFIRSLQQYVSSNAEWLRVNLLTPFDTVPISKLLYHLSVPLRRCFTCLSGDHLWSLTDNAQFFKPLTAFPNLTSLKLSMSTISITTAFSFLAQLPQLVQLSLNIYWSPSLQDELPPSPPPRAQLFSVKWLHVSLVLTFHSQLHWLNLPVTVPNVQEISLDLLSCKICNYSRTGPVFSSSSRRCLRIHLRLLMDLTGTPSHRIACFDNEDQQISAEELLAEEQ